MCGNISLQEGECRNTLRQDVRLNDRLFHTSPIVLLFIGLTRGFSSVCKAKGVDAPSRAHYRDRQSRIHPVVVSVVGEESESSVGLRRYVVVFTYAYTFVYLGT